MDEFEFGGSALVNPEAVTAIQELKREETHGF